MAQISAFILAGGKSSRMGEDKAFLELDGRSLLRRALELAREITPNTRIVGSCEKFAPHAPVVEDVFRSCGPLGGIHAALQASSAELNLILAVDMPFVSSSLLRYLLAQAQAAPDAAAIVPRCGGRWQPLCAVYRHRFAAAAESALRAGRNKIGLLLEDVSTRVIEEEELRRGGFSSRMFRNLNTPEDLNEARKADSARRTDLPCSET